MKKKAYGRRTENQRNHKFDRRTFVKMLPAVGVAGLAAPHLDGVLAKAVQQQRAQTPQRVTKEMMHAAEQLIGIELNDAQEVMALPGVNRSLASYEALRKIDVPLDTEPATAFHPTLPGKKFNGKPATKFRPSKQEIPKYNSHDEVAFFTATQLAELVRARQVSSTDLTKMYLARLKRFGPKLLGTSLSDP